MKISRFVSFSPLFLRRHARLPPVGCHPSRHVLHYVLAIQYAYIYVTRTYTPSFPTLTVIFPDASGTSGFTATARGAALALRSDETGQLRQHHLTGTTAFGASSHGELKTLAVIVDAITAACKLRQSQPHHMWVVIDAAVDFQIVRRLARQPLHKATDSSLGTQALNLWVALRHLPGHFILHLMKQESHRYSLGNEHIDLHTHNQLAENVPAPDEPPLCYHMHTHLQHLPPIPHPGEPPP